MNRRTWSLIRLLLLSSLLLLPSSALRADGGAVRLSERVGNYQVTVFTAPTPLRAGPVDVSVFVQDPATGEPLPDMDVTISVRPGEGGEEIQTARATHEAATNKLFQAASLELPAAGPYQVEVALTGPRGPARTSFRAEAAGPPPRWLDMGLWLAWPLLPVALFGVHQVLVWRRKRC